MVLKLLLGTAGFVLYLLYDINSFVWKNRLLHLCFTVGTVLIMCSTVLMCIDAWKGGAFAGIPDIIILVFAFIALLALIYSLFFALPFSETYSHPENGRKVYSYGLYAVCRHPGIICFFVFYLLLGLAALPSGVLLCGIYFSVLNVFYALFQDRVTFVKTFSDYELYRTKVPFLIPSKRSIKRAVHTWGYPYDKEEEL